MNPIMQTPKANVKFLLINIANVFVKTMIVNVAFAKAKKNFPSSSLLVRSFALSSLWVIRISL